MRAFFSFLCLFASADLFGQITLDAGSYPVSLLGTDSLKVTTVSSIFPTLATGGGNMWDLSGVTDSSAVLFIYRVVASIPNQFADSNQYKNFAGYNYQGNLQTSINITGIKQLDLKIDLTQYNILPLTSGPTDSFIIPAQVMAFSSPRTKIAFPATFETSWSSAYQSDLSFKLTWLIGGDTLAPGIVRRYTIEKDTVTGWGKMSVKDAAGIPSPYLNVLQVQTMITYTDSFFMNGAPLSPTMLTFFSITQGRSDTIYEQNYYRPQEVTPLAQVEYRDSGYTQAYKATTHVQRLEDVGVPHVVNAADIKLYPNPVCDHTVFVALPSGGGAWSYELADATGRKIMNGSLRTANGPASIFLPAQLNTGIYYLGVYSEQRQVTVLPINFEK